jgi:hypothetical protein
MTTVFVFQGLNACFRAAPLADTMLMLAQVSDLSHTVDGDYDLQERVAPIIGRCSERRTSLISAQSIAE